MQRTSTVSHLRKVIQWTRSHSRFRNYSSSSSSSVAQMAWWHEMTDRPTIILVMSKPTSYHHPAAAVAVTHRLQLYDFFLCYKLCYTTQINARQSLFSSAVVQQCTCKISSPNTKPFSSFWGRTCLLYVCVYIYTYIHIFISNTENGNTYKFSPDSVLAFNKNAFALTKSLSRES